MNEKVRLSRQSREELAAEVIDQVRRHQIAQDAFDEAATTRLGVNRTDGRCLDILDRLGPITAGDLARESGLSTGAVTTLIDRLERRGYVRRARDTEDRRRVFIELTDELHERAGEIWGPLAGVGDAFLRRHSDAELRLLRDFLRDACAVLEEHAARVRGLPPRE